MRQSRLTRERERGRMLREIEASQVHQWPMVKASADTMGVVEVSHARGPSAMAVEPGTMVVGLVWETVSGRRPLDRLEEFLAQHDPALLWGKALPAQACNDETVGRRLDRLAALGTMQRFTAGAVRADTLCGLDTRHGPLETTSLRVDGEAARPEAREVPCTSTQGSRTETRPDLKPCVLATVCVDRAVPLWGAPHAGNASDQTVHHTRWSTLAPCLAPPGVAPGAYTDVADAALGTAEHLAARGDTGCSRR